MSDIFRKSVMNRLPAMLPPTRAPWAGDDEGEEEMLDDDELEELEDGQVGDLPDLG